MSDQAPTRSPLVLVATDQEWSSRALESSLAPKGYAFIRAYNARQAFDLTARSRPDLIMIASDLAEASGFEVCRTLREKRLVTDSTAILMLVNSPVSRETRLEAWKAGASDCVSFPVDGEELGLRLRSLVRPKFDADDARANGLVDSASGLYNLSGLLRRARELTARAYRDGSAMTCVILSASPDEPSIDTERLVAHLGEQLYRPGASGGRVSDVIGLISGHDIAIFAPATDEEGAERLVERMSGVIGKVAGDLGMPSPRFRSGRYSVSNFRDTPVDPNEMLLKASASRQSPGRGLSVIHS